MNEARERECLPMMRRSPFHPQQRSNREHRKGPVIRSLHDVREALAGVDLSFYSASDMPFFVAGLDKILERYRFITTSTRTAGIAPSNVEVFSSYSPACHASRKSLAEALRNKDVLGRIEKDPRPICFIVYEFDQEALRICEERGWKILGNDLALKRWLENKCNFPVILEEAGVEGLPYELVNPTELGDWSALSCRFGFPYVVQLPANHLNGSGTFFINSPNDVPGLHNAWRNQETAKVTKFVKGYSLNTSACVTGQGILLASYFHQLVGIPELIDLRGGYCGNDTFRSYALGESTKALVYEYTVRTGEALRRRGFRGCYGIDFVVDTSGHPYPVELNPRFQSTLGLLNDMQLETGEVPLLAFHVLEHLQISYEIDVQKYNQRSAEFPTQDRSQMVIYHKGQAGTVQSSLAPGVYTIAAGKLQYLHHGLSVSDLNDQDAFLITRLLEAGQRIATNAMMHVVQFKRSILTERFDLVDSAKEICRLIRSAVSGEPEARRLAPHQLETTVAASDQRRTETLISKVAHPG